MPLIYLDHAATAPVFPGVLDAMIPWFESKNVGNANSSHTQGLNAKRAIESARRHVAELINADPEEIFFTASGSESNKLWTEDLQNRTFFTSKVEHNSLYNALSKVRNYRVLKTDSDGALDLDYLEWKLKHSRVRPTVSVMWVNNELGSINPMKEIGKICRKYGALLHTDGVQAVGHIPVDVKAADLQYLSLAGHKFGAPLGVGALYVSKYAPNYSSIAFSRGTPNVPGIVGLGMAAVDVAYMLPDLLKHDHWEVLRHMFETTLRRWMPCDYRINGGNNVSENIISLTIPGVNAETLMMYLDKEDIYVSTGSACNSNSGQPSHVLSNIGMSYSDAMSTIRISTGYDTKFEDVIQAAEVISKSVKKIKAIH